MKYDYMKNQNIQIRKGWKALLWNQVKSKMESSYSELVLVDDNQPLIPSQKVRSTCQLVEKILG